MTLARHTFAFPRLLAAAAVLAALSSLPAWAQNACKTPNCLIGTKPVECANVAAARIPLVSLTTSGFSFVFIPSTPKIEPGDCIEWRSEASIHSSSENTASATDDLCMFSPPPGTLWDTGNLPSGAGANSSGWCFYDAATFPAGTGDGYYCRIHATPTTGTMRGTLRVTTEIELQVDKSGADAKLTWTGGGVAGDVTYKVVKSADDPTFTPVNVQTVNPDGGVTGTTFTDVGALADPVSRYYLVRNKQTNE